MVCGRTPEAPCAEARELQRHHQPHDRRRHRLADAGGVRQHDVALQRREVVAGDAHARELAEAGVDAVDRLAPRDDGVDRPRRSRSTAAAHAGSSADAGAAVDRAPVGKRRASPGFSDSLMRLSRRAHGAG